MACDLGRVAEANRIDYERAQANEASLSRSLDSLRQNAMDTSMALVKLRELEREVEQLERQLHSSSLIGAAVVAHHEGGMSLCAEPIRL